MTAEDTAAVRSPWTWVPTLYFAQGIPYFVVTVLAGTMYKNLGVSNAEITFVTSLLGLPWVLKPLWSPLAEMFGTKRGWIASLQLAVGIALALLALTVPGPMAFQISLAVFLLIAFASASHDIAADGFYMLGLRAHEQAAFVGVRSTFFRLSNISIKGGLVYLAGYLIERTASVATAWALVFYGLAGLFAAIALYHWFILPRPRSDTAGASRAVPPVREFFSVFAEFFRKPGIAITLGFLLLYRFPEAQLLALTTPFLLDPVSAGGLGLSTMDNGFVYGTVGTIALTIGGLLGGWIISRMGLKRALWPLVLMMHVPNVMFLLLASVQPGNMSVIAAAIGIEQFGYGLGFTVYLMYMILVADGPHKTAHYALCTGFMAMGMLVPGLWSGWLQQQLGYVHFFAWVLVATIPSLLMTALIKIPAGFGLKTE